MSFGKERRKIHNGQLSPISIPLAAGHDVDELFEKDVALANPSATSLPSNPLPIAKLVIGF